MTYCTKCGTSLQDDALFCPECGTKSEKAGLAANIPNAESIPAPVSTALLEPGFTLSTPVAETNPLAQVVPVSPPSRQFCRNCGKEVDASAFGCFNCGLPPMKAFNFCPACGSDCHQNAVVCIKCGVKLDSQDSIPKSNNSRETGKAYCRNCGKEVFKGAVACISCGLPPGKSKNFCPSCGSETHNEAIICVKCGTALEQFAAKQTQQSQGSIQKAVPVQNSNVIIVRNRKSTGLAFILTFFFGPFGLLYASPVGGIIMIFVSIIVGALTFGVGLFFTWIACMIWAVVAAQDSR